MKKKYFVLIADGMADLPLKELKGKTPLEYAKTPNMDFLAKNGIIGEVLNVPIGMPPGSDVASMSIFGYDPKEYYTGRGPLEAASLGVKLDKTEVAFRCNLVTIKDGIMDSFTADHISTKEAIKLIDTLDKKMGNKAIKFYPGLSYRHLLVFKKQAGEVILKALSKIKCVPPHDISGKDIEAHLPKGDGDKILKLLMKESIMHLLEHPTNISRIKKGKKPASMIWLWGQGEMPGMESFKKKYKKTGAVITAVHLLKGLGRILGLEVVDVKGATGFLDTNYKGKASAAINMIKKHDIVFLHVEAPDECGHMGDLKGKIRAIEDFDSKIVAPVISYCLKNKDANILVLPDHPTPIKSMTHTSDPVPFLIYGKGKKGDAKSFSEKEAKRAKNSIKSGASLLKKFFS